MTAVNTLPCEEGDGLRKPMTTASSANCACILTGSNHQRRSVVFQNQALLWFPNIRHWQRKATWKGIKRGPGSFRKWFPHFTNPSPVPFFVAYLPLSSLPLLKTTHFCIYRRYNFQENKKKVGIEQGWGRVFSLWHQVKRESEGERWKENGKEEEKKLGWVLEQVLCAASH